ncbi:MAG TPA: D-alanyl-D-alanine carboxypeptidase family protein [Novosphingobium sp.]|nr:D-alanyl-D-alanine carboxypeptidase family protein [Novosphingobium sp.]
MNKRIYYKGVATLTVAAASFGLIWAKGGSATPQVTVALPVSAPAAPATATPADVVTPLPPEAAGAVPPDTDTRVAVAIGGKDGAPVAAMPPVPAGEPAPPPEVAAAPIAMLVDLESGRVLYARDADRSFLPASVTKTMTAFVAFELMAQGKLSPDRQIRVSDEAWKEWHTKGSRMFLERASTPTVDQLLMGILNVSANDGAVVLAEGVGGSVPGWVAMMNACARRLGMTESHFGTPNGWMDKGHTFVSARDMVKLATAMLTRYPQYYHRYVGRPGLTWNGITQANHDPTLGIVPGADGIKTGFTGEAHYNFLGSAERDGRRLVMVLASVPTPRERTQAARALLEWGFKAWSGQTLVHAGAPLGEARVQGGVAPRVALVAPRAYGATVPRGTSEPVTMRIVYRGPLMAPIAKGTPVAELEIRVGNSVPSRMPLLAGADVPQGGTMDRLRTGLARLFARG